MFVVCGLLKTSVAVYASLMFAVFEFLVSLMYEAYRTIFPECKEGNIVIESAHLHLIIIPHPK